MKARFIKGCVNLRESTSHWQQAAGTSKDRCVPLLSDIKVRKKKEVFIY